ncbi:Transcription factor gsfR2 [Colletotrichum orbiculare MAFF 240422]|uniref:Transcription factor gsfR2 n=1 Tax=Colletotrichum orbiculare (strain 104-T / ATCC 96160 / CBS 514.97 / LARS 414 / MAFF 240422) TaxID=1213857 RepID=A0A484FN66_COLOR|nr:Transcription factor gsfR2 [Colletotrichum orbiculare MAFF 240422]
MVMENQTPWCHPYLYRAHMPREMQDAQACCALYIAKNQYNASIILRTIQSRAHEALASPLPTDRLDLLARVHAICLYQIIRLFDGDIPMRASAQQSLVVLETALVALLPFVRWETSQPEVGPAEDLIYPTKESWQEWIFQESTRRTLFFACFLLVAHQILIGQQPERGCTERYLFCHSWTLSAHLWKAPTVVDFAVAWREKRHFVVTKNSLAEAWRDAAADDVDAFGRIMMVGAMGVDDARLWFYSRGGCL